MVHPLITEQLCLLKSLEIANDYFSLMEPSQKYKVIGGILSPVSNGYGKASLIPAEDRLEMCRLASEGHSFITVEPWEALKSDWTPTFQVLKHFDNEIRREVPNVKVMLLCGSDLIEKFRVPSIWNPALLKELIENFGIVVIERTSGAPLVKAVEKEIFETDLLFQVRRNIFLIPQLVPSEISSSKLRLLIQRGHSIKYLTPDSVIGYINKNNFYN